MSEETFRGIPEYVNGADESENILMLGSHETALAASRGVSRLGYKLIHLNNETEAGLLLAQHENNIHLIIIEVVIPEMEGLSAMRKLRSCPECDIIPILAIVEGHQAAIESIRCGAADYIPKVELNTASFGERVERTINMALSNAENAVKSSELAPEAHDGLLNMLQYVTYAKIAQALSSDYIATYYVDTENDTFIEYSSDENYSKLGIEKSGYDYFGKSVRHALQYVFEEDRERFLAAHNKEKLLSELEKNGVFSMIYRLLLDGVPTYVCMKATRLKGADDPHIVIGIYSVQSEMEQKRERETYSSIARALATNYFSIYYVDIDTDEFIEFSSSEDYLDLGIEKSGSDFFTLCRSNALRVIYPEDQQLILNAMEKEHMLRELKANSDFTLTYRLIYDGKPTYVRMKATRMPEPDDNHIVIGVTSVEREMEQRKASETYSSIAKALAADYFSIYYVDTETDEFIEFSSTDNYLELGIEKKGSDFFELSKKNSMRVIYPEDQEMLIEAIDKQNMLRELEKNGTFMLTYRLMYDGEPTYVSLKATKMKDRGDKHIVIGIASVEAQMRRERELTTAREIANRDALTGVKSKHAFVETQAEINAQIKKGAQMEFAVIVCDLNDLKIINDTLGHNAGDKHIKYASEMICHTFQHSPVFRIGGDEFVVVMSGSDYTMRDERFAELLEMSLQNLSSGGVVIACGMSEYDPSTDNSIECVFDRADQRMYENKKALKGGRK